MGIELMMVAVFITNYIRTIYELYFCQKSTTVSYHLGNTLTLCRKVPHASKKLNFVKGK